MAKTRQQDDVHLITPEELLHSPKANVKEDTTTLSDKGIKTKLYLFNFIF